MRKHSGNIREYLKGSLRTSTPEDPLRCEMLWLERESAVGNADDEMDIQSCQRGGNHSVSADMDQNDDFESLLSEQGFKSDPDHKEIELHSIEMASPSERRFEPPCDSLEPAPFGAPRGSDEMIWTSSRHTDELVIASGSQRRTDELFDAQGIAASSVEPHGDIVDIKAESEDVGEYKEQSRVLEIAHEHTRQPRHMPQLRQTSGQ